MFCSSDQRMSVVRPLLLSVTYQIVHTACFPRFRWFAKTEPFYIRPLGLLVQRHLAIAGTIYLNSTVIRFTSLYAYASAPIHST